jgi:hypothetical protein
MDLRQPAERGVINLKGDLLPQSSMSCQILLANAEFTNGW